MEKIYQDLGLTLKEGEVYEALLRLGESPVADILRVTSDHPQIIYRAVDSLIAKNLVFATFRRHRKYVRAEDPNALLKIAEEKMSRIKHAIPDLMALQQSSKDTIVKVYQGNEGLRSVREQAIDSIQEEGTYLNIGGSGNRFYEIMGERLLEIERKRIKKRITKKVVTFESQREGTLKNNEKFLKFCEFRFLPEEYPSPSSTSIYNNTVAIFVFSENPVVVTLESPEMAESYSHYFETLWKSAKP